MGEFVGGAILGLLWGAILTLSFCGEDAERRGERTGRCIELCRPEKLVELVNGDKECLCATKRVRLQP